MRLSNYLLGDSKKTIKCLLSLLLCIYSQLNTHNTREERIWKEDFEVFKSEVHMSLRRLVKSVEKFVAMISSIDEDLP